MTQSSSFLFLLLLAGIVFAGFRKWAQWLEDSNLYYPDRILEGTPAQWGLVYDEVIFQTEDRLNLYGWFIPGPQAADQPTVLYCHGNGGNISHRLEKARLLNEAGLNLFFFDYRGFGKSEGRPSEAGTYRDTTAAYRYLTENRGIPADRIIVYGESLGGAMAVELAARLPVRSLVLEAAFTSTLDMARMIFPWLPVKWLVRHRYDNIGKIPNVKVPLLLFHSPTDEVVPFWMGQKLYSAATSRKTFVEIQGGHNDGFSVSEPVYSDSIRSFVGEKLSP